MGWIIERGMVPVNCEIAIFDLKGALAPQDKPLMLQPVLFCPVLTWAAQELMDCGVQRYFIVCPENCRQEVLDDLPGCDVTFFDHAEAALSAAGGAVVMVPGPVVPVYGPEDGRSVYAADSQVLLARLRAGTPLTDCPAEAAGVRSLWRPQALAPAFRPFDSAAALTAAMPDARELILRRLAEKSPDQIVKKNRQTFTVPKRCVSVREPYSAERRKAASERAKAAGYRPPVPKAGGK